MPRRRRRRKRPAEVPPTAARGKPFRDLPEHLAVDQLIRSLGFSIFRRRTGRPTLWLKAGSTYSQDEILACYVSEEELWEMEYRQMIEAHLGQNAEAAT